MNIKTAHGYLEFERVFIPIDSNESIRTHSIVTTYEVFKSDIDMTRGELFEFGLWRYLTDVYFETSRNILNTSVENQFGEQFSRHEKTEKLISFKAEPFENKYLITIEEDFNLGEIFEAFSESNDNNRDHYFNNISRIDLSLYRNSWLLSKNLVMKSIVLNYETSEKVKENLFISVITYFKSLPNAVYGNLRSIVVEKRGDKFLYLRSQYEKMMSCIENNHIENAVIKPNTVTETNIGSNPNGLIYIYLGEDDLLLSKKHLTLRQYDDEDYLETGHIIPDSPTENSS